MSETWSVGIVMIAIVFVIVAIPCLFTGWLGYKMLKKLAYFPSKNPAIQMGIFLKLLIVEVVSITLLLVFYHVLADYSKDEIAPQVKYKTNRSLYHFSYS